MTNPANGLVTGSAAAGTALATGTKTRMDMVGVDTLGTPLVSALDIAVSKGMKTALVTDAAVTDATGKLHTLGKPGNLPNAIEQLTLCSGNTVTFYTALSLVHNAKHATLTECETVKVSFKKLTDAQIERYLLSEQPYDCAGSFKSEGKGVLLFERIESRDPNTLIGMPVMLLRDMLAKWQIDLASIVLR